MLSAPPGAAPSSGFGASQSAAGNAFGQPAAQNQAAAAPLFGQMATPQSAPAFGTPSMSFGFGQSQAAAAAAATGGGFSFGQTQAAGASPSMQAFGTSTQHSTPSMLHLLLHSIPMTTHLSTTMCHPRQASCYLNDQSFKLCKY
jgi:hypothetical protein